jgi:hypothetical protein
MSGDYDDIDAYCYGRVGSVIASKWRLDRVLGIGGMAAVYAATHRNGSTAALKVLHRPYAAEPQMRERFLREAYIANLANHEGIVKVHDDAVDETGSPFLVMELLEGSSVADKADARGGLLEPRDAVWVGCELLSILEAAHAQGIVHRDIKPDNLFWTKDGKLKVLDFGIARVREAAPSKRTQTGMSFGTPGYMAPEQALGRWAQVDGRTDLWAVGATIFNLLTGLSVHEGETDNERLVNAATRSATSLGRAMPSAPASLVAVVDRSLDFDQARRYPDARAMRLELEAAAAEVGSALAAPPQGAGHAAAQGAPGVAAKGAEEVPEIDELLADTSQTNVAAMKDAFALVEKAMKSRAQYGAGHKEVERRLEVAHAAFSSSFAANDEPLAFSIRAYGFTAREETVWEPRPPLDKVCYRLFSDGIRAIALLPGLTIEELAELVRILVADASSEITREDNTATLLWDARFEHVLYEEGEAFAEGDQRERALFEKKRAEVLAGATFDTSDQLEDAWRAHAKKSRGADPEARQRALVGAVGGGTAASATAQAAGMRAATHAGRVDPLAADQATRAVLQARLEVSDAEVGERFAGAASAAFVLAFRQGEPGLVAGPLRTAVDVLDGESAADDALAFVSLLAESTRRFAPAQDREAATAFLVNALVSPKTVASLTAATTRAASPEQRARFSTIVRNLDGNHVAAIARAVSTMDPGGVRDELLAYVTAHASGHEGEIGASFANGHLEPSLALLKVLSALGTPVAREAAQEATRSPHPIVRIEALGLVEGASGVGIRQTLRAMLEDWDPAVRLAALRSIAAYRVKVAGPGLVMRVKSPEFDGLPIDERREALNALFMLTAARAETVCLELLADTRLVAAEPHEQTRALAAELLGRHGRSPEARSALETASHGRWRNSERVRVAAGAAFKAFDSRPERASDLPPASTTMGTRDATSSVWPRAETPPEPADAAIGTEASIHAPERRS